VNEKTLPKLLINTFDALLASEDFYGKLRNDAGDDIFCG
jgi:hypothetical protein